MPLYYFDIADGGRFDDADGLELRDVAAARAEALAVARDLMRIGPTRMDWSRWVVRVADARGEVILTLSFRDATLAIPGGNHGVVSE
jgi:hypothetical protein